jgi:hypothetical protein
MLFFDTRQEKRHRKEMKTVNNTEPALPSNRAFVVQFRTAMELAPGRYAGRVEHLVSGRAARFESWEQCRLFIEQTLANVGGSLGAALSANSENKSEDERRQPMSEVQKRRQ